MKTDLKKQKIALGFVALLSLASCGDGGSSSNSRGGPQQEQGGTPETQTENQVGPLGDNGLQVERLARPAINEGLIITNAFLNAFNSIPPSADLSEAAAPVRAEAITVIDATDMIDGKDDLKAEVVAGAFLPDVMRIDTAVNIAPGKTAYNADLSGDKGILTGGRKIEDDVIDITLSFLVAADPSGKSVKDNVSYAGVSGSFLQPGHKLLYQQKRRLGPAQFPFLATPN